VVDDHKVGWRAAWGNLACRGEAHEQLASARKKLLGHKHGEGRANNATDDPDVVTSNVERIEFGVIARPPCERLCRPYPP
jgi:hypothetical protein